MALGLAALTSACAQMGDEDRSLIEQASADAQRAEQAAEEARAAAEEARAAAAEAADAASAAQMSAERQDRMMQQTMRK